MNQTASAPAEGAKPNPIEAIAVRVQKEKEAALSAFALNREAFLPIRDKWLAVKLTGPEDPNLKEAVEIYRRTQKTRTAIEATRKNVKEPFLEAGRAIDGRAKELTGLVVPLENHLKAQLDRVEAEKEARRQAFLQARIKTLVDAGFAFDGIFYTAGETMLAPSKIGEISDEDFVAIVEAGRKFTEEAARKKAEEAAELARLEKLRKEIPAEVIAKAAETPAAPTIPPPTRMVFAGGEIVLVEEAAVVDRAGAAIVTASESNAMAGTKSFAELMNRAYCDGVNHTVKKVLALFDDQSIKSRGEFRSAVEALRV